MNDDLKQWSFIVPGRPVGKQRPRITRRGYAYTPAKSREYEELVAAYALEAGVQECAYVHIGIVCRLPCPQRKGKEPVREPRKRPDLDNIAKCILDGLQDIAYSNDKDVLGLSIRWQFIPPGEDAEPDTEVIVTDVAWQDYKETTAYRERMRGTNTKRAQPHFACRRKTVDIT